VEPPPLEVLIVFGSRINPEGRAGRIARMRVEHALRLWRQSNSDPYLLLTGGRTSPHPVSEARAMADYALERMAADGGPELRERLAACLLLEEASLNTWDSARHTLPLIQDLNLRVVGLISDALHLRRARYLFRRHYRRHAVTLRPLPVPGVIRHYWNNRRYLWLAKMALRETGAWLKVLARGALPRRPR